MWPLLVAICTAALLLMSASSVTSTGISGDCTSECSKCEGSECLGNCDIAKLSDFEDTVAGGAHFEAVAGRWEPLPVSTSQEATQAACKRADCQCGMASECTPGSDGNIESRGCVAFSEPNARRDISIDSDSLRKLRTEDTRANMLPRQLAALDA